MGGRKVMRSFVVDEDVDRALSHLAVDVGAPKSELYELGARLIIALARAGYVPDTCGYVLDEQGDGLGSRLAALLRKARKV